jgi:hypothetical protein
VEGFELMEISHHDFLKGLLAGKKHQLQRLRIDKEVSNAIYESKLEILEKDTWDIEQQLEEGE